VIFELRAAELNLMLKLRMRCEQMRQPDGWELCCLSCGEGCKHAMSIGVRAQALAGRIGPRKFTHLAFAYHDPLDLTGLN
jgi:hypothetical protein